jgi:integrase
MYADALNEGLCPENPFANLRLPQSRGRKDLVVLTTEEIEVLADTAVAVYGPSFGAVMRGAILFAAGTGVRPSELWALERSAICLDQLEASIHQTVGVDGRIKALTKNYRVRRVVVTPMAVDGVSSFARRLDSDFAFPAPNGKHFTRSQWDRYWVTGPCGLGHISAQQPPASSPL